MPDGTRDDVAELGEVSSEVTEQDVVRHAIALTKRIEDIELELTPLKDELKALQPKLVARFEETGDQKRTVDGRTAYLRREFWVYPDRDKEKAEVAAALKEAGLGDYVKEDFNTSSVSAFARELEKEADWEESGALLEDAKHPFIAAHPELEGYLVPTEKFSVRIVKS